MTDLLVVLPSDGMEKPWNAEYGEVVLINGTAYVWPKNVQDVREGVSPDTPEDADGWRDIAGRVQAVAKPEPGFALSNEVISTLYISVDWAGVSGKITPFANMAARNAVDELAQLRTDGTLTPLEPDETPAADLGQIIQEKSRLQARVLSELTAVYDEWGPSRKELEILARMVRDGVAVKDAIEMIRDLTRRSSYDD